MLLFANERQKLRYLPPLLSAEELWCHVGHAASLAYEPWPVWDEALAVDDVIDLPVQVNGKVRGRLTVPADTTEQDLEQMALADATIAPHIAGRTVVKVVVARGRLVSIVVK